DDTVPGNLSDWDDSFALVLGNEVSSDRQWQGKVRLLAIHNRALTQEQITQNYAVGVGEKYFLLFSVSELVGLPDSYIVFEVSQFDEFSYLFRQPRFISLDPTVTPGSIPIKGMRIGINGKETPIGQAYSNLNGSINDLEYTVDGQPLSELGTIIPLEKGPDSDEFFLTFELLGTHANTYTEPAVLPPAEPTDDDPAPDIGLRIFEEIDASMSELTGVSRTDTLVQSTYETIRQQLPSSENINGFLSAHQVGVSQLAIEYCSALIDDSNLRSSLFPGFIFTAEANTVSDASWQDMFVVPMVNRFMGQNLNTQPLLADVRDELMTLLTETQDLKPYIDDVTGDGIPDSDPDGEPDGLARCSTACTAGRTEVAAKAACAAALGSAVMLIQ
ncbi:MAG: LamG domain-containing protein, partial [Pseudomonadota bacterium]